MTTTWRQDWVAALLAVLEDESTANPALLRKVYSSRPGSFGETPAAYIEGKDETITHDAGTRTRTFTGGSVVIVDTYRDNDQTGDQFDILVDNLVDRFDNNVQRVGSSILELTGVLERDVELTGPERTVVYRGVVLQFGRSFKMEGRQ